jgi:hypothetical protein
LGHGRRRVRVGKIRMPRERSAREGRGHQASEGSSTDHQMLGAGAASPGSPLRRRPGGGSLNLRGYLRSMSGCLPPGDPTLPDGA